MAGRFPFTDPNNPTGNPQRAAMRAALGLPSSFDEMASSILLESQQHIEAQHRELRYRQAMYENQMVDQEIQALQIRQAVEVEQQIPELQQHYANLILRERLARGMEAEQAVAAAHHQQQQAAAAAYRRQVAAEQHYAATAAAVPHPFATAAAATHPAHAASVQAAAAQLRHQEELRQQHQQQQQTAALQAHLRGASPALPTSAGVPPGLDQLVMRNAGAAVAAAPQATSPPAAEAISAAAGPPPEEVAASVEQQKQRPAELSRNTSADSMELEGVAVEPNNKKQHPDLAPLQGGAKKKRSRRRGASEGSAKPPPVAAAASAATENQDQSPEEQPPKRKRGRPKKESAGGATSKSSKKNKEKVVDEDEQRMRAEAILQAMAERAAGLRFEHETELEQTAAAASIGTPQAAVAEMIQSHAEQALHHPHIPPEEIRHASSTPKESGPPNGSPAPIVHREVRSITEESQGTLASLLEAANTQEKAFDGAHVLQRFKGVSLSEFEFDEAEETMTSSKPKKKQLSASHDTINSGLPVPSEAEESIVTNMLQSYFPKLPEEPLYDGTDEEIMDRGVLVATPEAVNKVDVETNENFGRDTEEKDAAFAADPGKSSDHKEKQDESKAKSNVLDYPYPVDTWWPSTSGRQRERHQMGETTDEDDFQDSDRPTDAERSLLRANEPKIQERLKTELEPGILEKLPHCRLHRVQRCSVTVAELVYCFQVTECYPKEVMVCCSVCGTWRHACCGGHYETYSMRKNVEEPFVPVCEQCHEEQKIVKNYPLANARIERQRVEQTRRGLATTAVMRSMSFSKHGGTYKWPLGSVSATHVGGHTRSVQARHDKAEKQWSDLLNRLSRGYGYRTKERQRIRTKELERLLVAIEDAEGQTDRHNMLLFLMRDAKRRNPVGFEEEMINLFDPAVPDSEFDSLGYTPTSRRTETHHNKKLLPADSEAGEEEDKKEVRMCVKKNCNNKSRFDSRFCSDACGVHVLEQDLLEAFYESNEIHPSVLRSHY